MHAGLHGLRLVPSEVKHGRGVLADPDLDGKSQSFVVVHIGAKCGQVQIQSYTLAGVPICRARTEPGVDVRGGKCAEQHRAAALCIRNQGSPVFGARGQSLDEILGSQGRNVCEQDSSGPRGQLGMLDPLANSGVEPMAVVG